MLFGKGLSDHNMAILELGDRDKDWINAASCNDQIVMIDCKTLYEEQVKYVCLIILNNFPIACINIQR